MLIYIRRSLLILLAIGGFALNGTSILLAQAVLPEPPDLTGGLEHREAPAEPGYLGLIADDRQDAPSGVRVVRVIEGTPAAKAGLAVNDLIVAIEGKPVQSIEAMAEQLRPKVAGDTVRFEVRRGNAREQIEVSLGRRPPPDDRPIEFGRIPENVDEPNAIAPPASGAPSATLPSPIVRDPFPAAAPRPQLLGIRTGVVHEEMRRRLRLPQPGGARVVSRVVGSPADRAGIPLESVIIAVDDQPVMSPTDLARLIQAAGPGKEVELTYFANGERHVARAMLADISARPQVGEGQPNDASNAAQPIDRAPMPSAVAQRIEELERRIRELEQRVKELEGALNPPADPPASGRKT